MYFGRRKRLKELAKAEAKGRSFWTDDIDQYARQKLFYCVDDVGSRWKSMGGHYELDIIPKARAITLRDLGLPQLSRPRYNPVEDSFCAILEADKDIVFTFIEAVIELLNVIHSVDQHRGDDRGVFARETIPYFTQTIQTILREHRVSFDLIDGRFIPFESREMHEKITVPVLTLLGGRSNLADIEIGYLAALEQIHLGQAASAITKAATALQEALTALGCSGNSLGPLAKSAESKGVITGYDKKLVDWVSADRSKRGDAHSVGPASVEDAWLVVHVVGALILRIVGGPLRGVQASR